MDFLFFERLESFARGYGRTLSLKLSASKLLRGEFICLFSSQQLQFQEVYLLTTNRDFKVVDVIKVSFPEVPGKGHLHAIRKFKVGKCIRTDKALITSIDGTRHIIVHVIYFMFRMKVQGGAALIYRGLDFAGTATSFIFSTTGKQEKQLSSFWPTSFVPDLRKLEYI